MLPPNKVRAMRKDPPSPLCPKCRKPMRFMLATTSGRQFQCIDCDGGDPLRSPAVTRLLNGGELKPPE
jgi:hypothetical protein